jgi:hypothetical protein
MLAAMTDNTQGERTSQQILQEWRQLVRAQEAVGPDTATGQELGTRIDEVRREYLMRFDKTAGRSTAGAAIVATSDDFIGALDALSELLQARDAAQDGDLEKLDAEIQQMSAEVLRLSELQLEGGDNLRSRNASIDDLAAQRERA